MTAAYRISAVPPSVVSALGLPPLEGLTGGQARGVECVWCRTPLSTESALDMGEHGTAADGRRWYPRACHPCTGEQAYGALFSHAPGCRACTDSGAGCDVGRTLVRLARQGRR